MPVINRIGDFAQDMTAWRWHIHANPELGFECHDTAAFVVERLRAFGVDRIETGVATSGVVAVIEGRGPGPAIRSAWSAMRWTGPKHRPCRRSAR